MIGRKDWELQQAILKHRCCGNEGSNEGSDDGGENNEFDFLAYANEVIDKCYNFNGDINYIVPNAYSMDGQDNLLDDPVYFTLTFQEGTLICLYEDAPWNVTNFDEPYFPTENDAIYISNWGFTEHENEFKYDIKSIDINSKTYYYIQGHTDK